MPREDPRLARIARNRGGTAPTPDPAATTRRPASGGTTENGGNAALDLALSPLRGIEEFGRDLVELPNILPGVDYTLPQGRIFGEAQTGIGKFATGIFEFAAGFVPGAGIAGKIGKGSRTFNLTKTAERAARISGNAGKAARISLARSAAAGALADFTVYDANEERLSNLINNSFPALKNPVTDFLAADEDEGQFEGRIKQVLEGAGIGTLLDTVMLGLRGVKAQRAARAADGDVTRAIDEALPAAEARKTFDDAGDNYRSRKEVEDASERSVTVDGEEVVKDTHKRIVEVEDPFVLSSTAAGRKKLLTASLRLTPDQIKTAEESFLRRREAFGASTQFEGQVIDTEALVGRVNPRAFTPDQRALLGVDAKGLNLAATEGEVDTAFIVRTWEALFGELPLGIESRLATVGDQQFVQESIEAVMDVADGDPALFATRVARAATDNLAATKTVGRVAFGLRHLQEIQGNDLVRLLDEGDLDDPATAAELVVKGELFAETTSAMRGGDAEAGRTLRSKRIAADAKDREAIAEVLRAAAGENRVREVAEQLRIARQHGGLAGQAATARIMQMTKAQGAWAVTTEFWINSILSGARTLTTNLISPVVTSFYRPLENMIGGAISSNSGQIRQGAQEVLGLAESFRESMTMASAVWKDGGQQILDPRATVRDDPFAQAGAIQAAVFGVDENTAAGSFINWFGKTVRTPSRILASTDEFVKQMNYRSVSRSHLMDVGVQQGLRGDDLAAHIHDGMAELTRNGQRYSLDTVTERAVKQATDEGLQDPVAHARRVQDLVSEGFDPSLSRVADDAIARAREVTFTEDLASGTLSSKLQAAVNAHPYLRLVVPFIRTPVNIVKFAGKRLPNPMGITEAALNRRMPSDARGLEGLRTAFAKEVLSGDPRRVSEAVGKQAAGLGGVLFFATAAAQGRITGRGPSDVEQREALLQAGWQPYSFNVGGKFVSYLRMDPFASLIGTVADLYDYSRMAPVDEQDNLSTSFMGLAMATANNFTNKTYLQGIGDVTAALSDPQRNLPGVLSQYVASFVPSALSQAVEAAGDPHLREVNSVLDRIKSRTPGFSDDLPPMRNLFGETVSRPRGFALGLENLPGVAGDIMSMVSPIVYRDVDPGDLSAELVRLQHGFSPPVPSRDGVDLMTIRNAKGQPAYDRWLELHGKTRLHGRTMKQELNKLIHSPTYQALSPISTSTDESPRIAAVGNVIRTYRAAAYQQMLREYPEVGRATDHAARTRRAFLAGQGTETTDVGFRVLPVAQPLTPFLGGLGGQ